MTKKPAILIILLLLILLPACRLRHKRIESPPGYHLEKPEKFFMRDVLQEVSGIAFNKGRADTIYAEQDEDGKLFYFKLGERKPARVKFGKNGDYEDVAICNNYAVLLKSDGTLFTFPLSEIHKKEAGSVKVISGLLPPGEYEGLCTTDVDHQLVVLCKHCIDDKTSESISGHQLQLVDYGGITLTGNFKVNVEDIRKLTGFKKLSFHPSGISQHPITKEWYILSSVNKLLVVADPNWKIKAAYHLKPSLFRQAEGITFDAAGNLYISNEGGELDSGNILKFSYDKASEQDKRK